jgi:hypothetical protein
VNNNFGTKPLDKIITETVSEAVSTIITEIQGLLDEGYVLVGSEFGLTEDVIADPVKITEAITSTIMSELKSVPAYQLWSKL